MHRRFSFHANARAGVRSGATPLTLSHRTYMIATSIRRMSPVDLEAQADELAQLLIETVNDGYSMGFLAPLTIAAARAYWISLGNDLQTGARLLLAADGKDGIVGTAQLALSPWSNSPHRAELQKIMVNGSARGRG